MALLSGTQLASAAKCVAGQFLNAIHKGAKTKPPNACKSTQPANQTFKITTTFALTIQQVPVRWSATPCKGTCGQASCKQPAKINLSLIRFRICFCPVGTGVVQTSLMYVVYCILYTVYCILYTVYCVLPTVYCTLYTVFCILYAVYCILYIVYCILCTAYCKLYTVSCTLYTVYRIVYTACRIQCTVHCILYNVFCMLYKVYRILCAVYCILYTVYYILNPVYCTLYTVQRIKGSLNNPNPNQTKKKSGFV